MSQRWCADGASRPRTRADSTASARLCAPSLAYRLPMWVLTVLVETDPQIARQPAQHQLRQPGSARE